MASYDILSNERLFLAHEAVECLHEGSKWNEGPVWLAASRTLIWSDIPNDRLLRFDAISRQVSVYRQPAGHPNGNTVDREGRLVTCEHSNRRVTRTGHDGSVTIVADSHGGKPLNSPNDVVVDRTGAIWFSDPTYGIDSDYFGSRSRREQDGNYLYRVDVDGTISAAVTDMVQPNGLAFSPDGDTLYVVDSGRTSGADFPAHIRRFTVGHGGALTSAGVLADCPTGLFDGIRVDADGRVWAGAGDGVYCYSPEGALLGRIVLGEPAINLCFGGPKLNELFVCAPSRLYKVFLRVRGLNPWGVTR